MSYKHLSLEKRHYIELEYKKGASEIAALIEKYIGEGWSPKQVADSLKNEAIISHSY